MFSTKNLFIPTLIHIYPLSSILLPIYTLSQEEKIKNPLF